MYDALKHYSDLNHQACSFYKLQKIIGQTVVKRKAKEEFHILNKKKLLIAMLLKI